MYTAYMEITITQFRRDLFTFVAKAQAGEPIVILHKGQRFRIVPETPLDRLSRLTPMQVINPNVDEQAEATMRDEMRQAWEQDWETL